MHYLDFSHLFGANIVGTVGPWWWSSGQRARLLLRWSEFESRWGLQFFCKIVIEKNENKQKEAGVGPFLKKTLLELLHEKSINDACDGVDLIPNIKIMNNI